VHHLDELLEHLFGHESAITPSFMGRMASMLPGTAQHYGLGFLTHSLDGFALGAAFVTNRHDREGSSVQHNAAVAHVDRCWLCRGRS
jgi:hypothetical protein